MGLVALEERPGLALHLALCVTQLSITMLKYLREITNKEEGFILALKPGVF